MDSRRGRSHPRGRGLARRCPPAPPPARRDAPDTMATAEAAGPGHVAPCQTQRPAPAGRCGDRVAALSRESGSPESMGVKMESGGGRRSQGAGLGGGGRGLPALGRAAALPFSAFPAVGCWGEALSRKGQGRVDLLVC